MREGAREVGATGTRSRWALPRTGAPGTASRRVDGGSAGSATGTDCVVSLVRAATAIGRVGAWPRPFHIQAAVASTAVMPMVPTSRMPMDEGRAAVACGAGVVGTVATVCPSVATTRSKSPSDGQRSAGSLASRR